MRVRRCEDGAQILGGQESQLKGLILQKEPFDYASGYTQLPPSTLTVYICLAALAHESRSIRR